MLPRGKYLVIKWHNFYFWGKIQGIREKNWPGCKPKFIFRTIFASKLPHKWWNNWLPKGIFPFPFIPIPAHDTIQWNKFKLRRCSKEKKQREQEFEFCQRWFSKQQNKKQKLHVLIDLELLIAFYTMSEHSIEIASYQILRLMEITNY